MFHLRLKPRPPTSGGRVTRGQAVDSSATISALGSDWKAGLVELPQKLDGLQILVSAVD